MLGRFVTIMVLVLLNGFFVAAEFALVRSRRTRLEAMTRKGDKLARIALRATGNLSGLLSASQLGVTLASLGLGWAAEAALREPFAVMFAGLPFALDLPLRLTLGAALAIGVITFLHVVFGELVPKAGALNHPERIARWLSPPLMLFAWIASPFTWVINKASRSVLRLFGQESQGIEETVHSPEELRILVEQSQEGGALQQQDADLLDAVFEFSEKNARDVMTPRTGIVALDIEATLPEVLAEVQESAFSRYPVYEDSIDDVVGIVLARDLLPILAKRLGVPAVPEDFTLRAVMRPVHVIPGSREVEDVLGDFKRMKEHMAIVLDEYGGTAGLVTMEDVLEEIVGEILDEYDEAAEESVDVRAGETLVAGNTNIGELNERFSLSVPDLDYHTIGGYVFGTLGRLAIVGDRVLAGGAIFTVREMEGRKIDTLAVDLHSLGDRRTAERASLSGGTEAAPQ